MKYSSLLILAFGISMSSCSASPSSKVLLAQTNTAKIAQVKAKKITTAYASWWGFNQNDATECLQNAIDSGASTLIVENMGSDWIISKTLKLASDQEIIFQKGVVIQAQKGAFKNSNESLIVGSKLTNVSLVGEENAIFQMHREDYANAKLYKKSEHRHGIALRDCKNIVLRNITVEETGGDGLYIGAASDAGYSKNILVDNCVFDGNYRQGISVISAEDLLIRRSKIINTKGTAPQAGIDFEPNRAEQRLVNCQIENSEISGNAGSGMEINVTDFNDTTLPISINVKKSKIVDNAKKPINILITRTSNNKTARGKVLFNECTFASGGIYMEGIVENTVRCEFKNSTLDYQDNKSNLSPIILKTGPKIAKPVIGGITFDNMIIKMNADILPIDFQIQRQGNVSNTISGSLLITRNGNTRPFDLKKFIDGQQKYFAQKNATEPDLAVLDIADLRAPANEMPRQGNNTFYLRSEFTFLQYAQKDETIHITARVSKVHARNTQIALYDPTGKKLQTYTIPYDNTPVTIDFTAKQTGIYQIKRTQSSSQRVDITSANPGNGIVADEGVDFLPKKGNLYFEVPAGVKKFTIGVSTNSPDAPAEVALIDPSGKEMEHQIIKQERHLFTTTRSNASISEIWSIKVSKATWTVTVYPYEGLTGIVSTNPATLLRKK